MVDFSTLVLCGGVITEHDSEVSSFSSRVSLSLRQGIQSSFSNTWKEMPVYTTGKGNLVHDRERNLVRDKERNLVHDRERNLVRDREKKSST